MSFTLGAIISSVFASAFFSWAVYLFIEGYELPTMIVAFIAGLFFYLSLIFLKDTNY